MSRSLLVAGVLLAMLTGHSAAPLAQAPAHEPAFEAIVPDQIVTRSVPPATDAAGSKPAWDYVWNSGLGPRSVAWDRATIRLRAPSPVLPGQLVCQRYRLEAPGDEPTAEEISVYGAAGLLPGVAAFVRERAPVYAGTTENGEPDQVGQYIQHWLENSPMVFEKAYVLGFHNSAALSIAMILAPDVWMGVASGETSAVADSGSPASGSKLAAAGAASGTIAASETSSDAPRNTTPAARVLFGTRPNYAFAVSGMGSKDSNPELIVFGADGRSSNRTCASVRS
jgi:hypothetical protein